VGVYVSNKEDNGHGNFVAMPYEGNRICLYFQSSPDTRHKRCFFDTDKELEILDNLDGEHSLLVGVISKPPKVIQGMAITEYGNQPSYFMLNVEPRPPYKNLFSKPKSNLGRTKSKRIQRQNTNWSMCTEARQRSTRQPIQTKAN
jgi:hypothetical protein